MTTSDPQASADEPPRLRSAPAVLQTVAFASEAHLPRERRLLIDGSGLLLETAFGIRHSFPWVECEAVLSWRDRVEIVLDREVSLVVRAADWHLGGQALQAIADRAPSELVVAMPDDPEPQPAGYELRGLATSPLSVLWILLLATGIVAVIDVRIGWSDRRWQALAVAVPFAVVASVVALAIRTRTTVPVRWRDPAAVRGRASVRLDSGIARAGLPRLWLALVVPGAVLRELRRRAQR